MKQTPAAAPVTPPSSKAVKQTGMGSLFEKENLIWMLGGLVIIAVGAILMAGGKSADPNVFNKNEVYGFRRITVAPIVFLAGLVVIIFAIFRRPKNAA